MKTLMQGNVVGGENFFLFLVGLGFEPQASLLLDILLPDHVPSPFGFSYFVNKVSHFCLGLPGL
jgi:hypothetical protein